MGNTIKTTLLLGTMTGLLVIFGDYFGGTQGMVIAFLFALLMNFGSYWYSDKIVLKMYRAREVTEAEAPELVGMVRSLSQRAQLPMPRVYIVPNESPNAFATGRNPQHAAVAVTSGILRIMNSEQLEGVLAHELGHVKHRDTLISAVAATLAGVIMMLAYMARCRHFRRGGWQGFRGSRGWYSGSPRHVHPGPHCRSRHPDGDLPHPGVSG